MNLLTQRLSKLPGGISLLARNLGISRQAIYLWEEIPEGRLLEVETITGIPWHELRPDLEAVFRPKGRPQRDRHHHD